MRLWDTPILSWDLSVSMTYIISMISCDLGQKILKRKVDRGQVTLVTLFEFWSLDGKNQIKLINQMTIAGWIEGWSRLLNLTNQSKLSPVPESKIIVQELLNVDFISPNNHCLIALLGRYVCSQTMTSLDVTKWYSLLSLSCIKSSSH